MALGYRDSCTKLNEDAYLNDSLNKIAFLANVKSHRISM